MLQVPVWPNDTKKAAAGDNPPRAKGQYVMGRRRFCQAKGKRRSRLTVFLSSPATLSRKRRPLSEDLIARKPARRLQRLRKLGRVLPPRLRHLRPTPAPAPGALPRL